MRDLLFSDIKDLHAEILALRDRKIAGQSAFLGDYTAISRTIFGHKIFIDTRDISLAPHLAMDGVWEMWITEAMIRILKPGMNCIDLGTNFGWYSLLMAHLIGSNGKLIGVDANPRMVELCSRTMSVNGFLDRSTIKHAAITDYSGVATFNNLNLYMGSGSLKNMGDTAAQFNDSMTSITVPAMTLDQLIDEKQFDFIKIDCEGAEPGIVRGGRRMLSLPKVQIFIEYAPNFYASGEAVEMISTFEELGYEFFAIDKSSKFEKLSRERLLNQSGWSELYLKRP
jgi:FkbM family methyltransferase